MALKHQFTPLSKVLQISGMSGKGGLLNTVMSVRGSVAWSNLGGKYIALTDVTGLGHQEVCILNP